VLRQIAEGVLVHESECIQSDSVVVQGRAGVLLIDPGITDGELMCLAHDLRELGKPVVAGFSTHPDWDHVLWHACFGDVPRFGTGRCAAALHDLLSHADWEARVGGGLPPEIADEVQMDLLGLVTGLSAGTAQIPWDGPRVRISEATAAGRPTSERGRTRGSRLCTLSQNSRRIRLTMPPIGFSGVWSVVEGARSQGDGADA